MQKLEVRKCIAQLNNALDAVDVDALSGENASELIDVIAPLSQRLSSALVSIGARAVACNQHNAESARSGASWIASKTGTSEKQARSGLGLHKDLTALPDVETSFRSGSLSIEAASIISRAAGSDSKLAAELLDVATTSSVDVLARSARESKMAASELDRFEKLRTITIHFGFGR